MQKAYADSQMMDQQMMYDMHFASQGLADASWQAWCDGAAADEFLDLYNACTTFAPRRAAPDTLSTWVLQELYGFLKNTVSSTPNQSAVGAAVEGLPTQTANQLRLEFEPGMDRNLMHIQYFFF